MRHRRDRLSTLAGALLGLLVAASAHARNVEWRNGRWYDGESFAPRAMYSVDGVLTERRPISIDSTVDLAGQYVVPAYGDAHHHGIDSADGLETKIARFLEVGVFYVKNPNVIPDLLTDEVRGRINTGRSIDVVFANGGLTASGGHPAPLHASLAARGVFKGLRPEDMENRAYFIIDSIDDLKVKWPRILAGRPDFIKTFLLYSAPHGTGEARKRSEGLDPGVLTEIVARAHRDGLRVTTHIETAIDFDRAVRAGVDEITHLPIPDRAVSPDLGDYLISATSAREAARRDVTVVATGNIFDRPQFKLAGENPEPAYLAAIRDNQRANLRMLADAGVRIAIGSDGISGEQPMVTALDEVQYLHRYGFFDARELLRMWTEHTAATIFPDRRIGRLQEGYEADFLVLQGDPLVDFSNVSRIALRVRQGEVLGTD
ncbi:MAG TPA: amidohydrolase family protein [Lysobacter sp.]